MGARRPTQRLALTLELRQKYEENVDMTYYTDIIYQIQIYYEY